MRNVFSKQSGKKAYFCSDIYIFKNSVWKQNYQKISNHMLPSSSAITTFDVPALATALGSVDDTDTVNSSGGWAACKIVYMKCCVRSSRLSDTFYHQIQF